MSTAQKRWVLVGLEGPVRDREFILLGQKISLGRTSDNDIELAHASISRKHAVIDVLEAGLRISDLESKNGVVVNGARGKSFDLKSGDKIILGACRFKIISEEVKEPDEAVTSGSSDTQKTHRRRSLPFQIQDLRNRLLDSKNRKVLLLILVALGIFAALTWKPSKEKPKPIAKEPPSFTPREELPKAPETPELDKVSEEDYEILRRQVESALLYEDAKQAHNILSKMNLYNPSDLWVKDRLTEAGAELRHLVDIYYETGAREYERKNYYRAISEWRKCMAFAKGYDEEKYEEALRKSEEAKREALADK